MKMSKTAFFALFLRISQNPDALEKFCSQIYIQRKKLCMETPSDSISLKKDIFMHFHLFSRARRKMSS